MFALPQKKGKKKKIALELKLSNNQDQKDFWLFLSFMKSCYSKLPQCLLLKAIISNPQNQKICILYISIFHSYVSW